jgi:hypothetical protein
MKKRLVIIITVGAVLLGAAAGLIYQYEHGRRSAPANAILIIKPYRHAGSWVFDDARYGLVKEPFIAGIPEMIDKMVEDIPNAETGFRLLFSAMPFPDYEVKLVWRRTDGTGNWYYCEKYDMEGWLCPALDKYYDEAPKELYAKAEAL